MKLQMYKNWNLLLKTKYNCFQSKWAKFLWIFELVPDFLTNVQMYSVS